MAMSLEDYQNITFWTNFLVYMLYIIIKYPVVALMLIPWHRSKCSTLRKEEQSERKWVKLNPMQWMKWMVKFVFRNQLELEEKIRKKSTRQKHTKSPLQLEIPNSQAAEDLMEMVPKERKLEESGKGDNSTLLQKSEQHTEAGASTKETSLVPDLQDLERGNGKSNKKEGSKIELNHRSTVILFTLIATFGLLAIGSALDVTLISVTHACTEDRNIHCYPQLINDKVDIGLNITTDKPIQDCSFWNSEGVSDKVSFVCYQFVLNVELFLAIIGGLSTVFVVTMRIIIKLLSVCCIRNYGLSLCIPRYVVIVLTSVIELGLVIIGMVLRGAGIDEETDTLGVIFLATHAAEILLVFGIIATLFWLPWEDYAEEPTDND